MHRRNHDRTQGKDEARLITAIDSNILFDIFGADSEFGPRAREALRRRRAEGKVVACGVVWAELAGYFPSEEKLTDTMGLLEIDFEPLSRKSALAAGGAWKTYRTRGGSRQRMIADFLIGGHALHQADRLLTRDRGFFKTYFRNLRIETV